VAGYHGNAATAVEKKNEADGCKVYCLIWWVSFSCAMAPYETQAAERNTSVERVLERGIVGIVSRYCGE
jgi:hypothetical protein